MAGLGAAGGLRTATPLAALQLRNRLLPWPWGAVVVAGSAAELLVDKLPRTGNRTSPPALAARVTATALAGWVVAGRIGAVVAAGAAAASAFGGFHARQAIVEASGLPDGAVATAEDLVAVIVAACASSPRWSRGGR